MRDYAMVLPEFWTGETGKAIRKEGMPCQLLALYLVTCPHANMIGLYRLSLPTMCHEIGMDDKGASQALRSLSKVGFAHYDRDEEVVWVPEMARFQIGDELKPADNRVKGVAREAAKLRKSRFFQDFCDRYGKPFHLTEELVRLGRPQGPPKPLRSQEQEQDQEQDKEPAGAGLPGALAPGPTPPPAPPPAPSPETAKSIVLEIDCLPNRRSGEVKWPLEQGMVDTLGLSFPGIDVLNEARKAQAWILCNMSRRKTYDGMKSFLFKWMQRAQNDGLFTSNRNGKANTHRKSEFVGARSEVPDYRG